MNTLKSAFVAVVMIVVLYGVYVMLTKKPVAPPMAGAPEADGWNPPQVDFAPPAGIPQLQPPTFADAQQPPQIAPAAPAPPGGVPPSGSGASPYWNDAAGQAAANPAGTGDLPPIVPPDALNRTTVPPDSSNSDVAGGQLTNPPQPYTPQGDNTDELAHAGSELANRTSAPADVAGFSMMWRGVQDQLNKGELTAALETLSLWYGSSDVPPESQQVMLDLLDQLAGEVIYSREHYLEEPHEVQPGEKLTDIARRYQVPWQLLANVNGIGDPSQVAPGTQLKVIRGPFDAVVDLPRKELTLMVGGRYAGRFPVNIGNDPEPMSGQYVVREKDTERTFYDRQSRAVPPGDPMNPYGPYWIGLGGQLGIHGAPEPLTNGDRPSTGSIIVAPDDARDLYAILSEDSQVTIQR